MSRIPDLSGKTCIALLLVLVWTAAPSGRVRSLSEMTKLSLLMRRLWQVSHSMPGVTPSVSDVASSDGAPGLAIEEDSATTGGSLGVGASSFELISSAISSAQYARYTSSSRYDLKKDELRLT